MKLTPLDIRHKEFKRGMRGYVDGEVDEFLDEIADEFERLFKENIELAERGESLQEKIDQYRNLEETLQNTLVAAQRSAEELKANAQKEAQLMLSEAELKARQMVNESYADKQAVEKQIVVLKSSEEDFRFKFRSLLEGYVKQLSEIDAESKKAGRFATPTDQIKEAMAHDAASRPGTAPPATKPAVSTPPPAARPAAPAPAASQAATIAPHTPPPPPQQQPPAQPAPAGSDAERPVAPPASGPDKGSSDPRAPFLGEPDDLLADVESEVDDNAFKW
ncbi:MAG: DivIVA domain-containing protein [Thermoleophilia bacterium]